MSKNMDKKSKRFRDLLKNRSRDYNEYGRYLVQDFSFKNVWLRLVGQLGDVIIMLLPIVLWIDLFLLITAGVANIKVLYASMFVVLILILISTVFGNTYFSILSKGQSFGKLALRTKVVDLENKELDNSRLIIREALGKEIPLIVLYLVFGYLGMLGFLVLNGLCVLLDPKHRSLIDFILKTKVVVLSEQGMKKREVDAEREPRAVKREASDNRFDLRLFSSFSHDGEFEVEDLFKQAKEVGLETISICDHNSVKANLIARQLTKLYDINYIDGITIDCCYKDAHVRLLGYGVNSSDQRFSTIEYENLAKEKAVSQRRVQLFEDYTGLHIDSEQLMSHSRFQVITPVMIARYVLSNANYQKDKLLQPYLYGNKRSHPISNFVEDFFGRGKVAFVPIIHPQLEDMIAAVKASGGKCVLAHPMFTFKHQPELIDEIITLGLDGLEVFNPRHNLDDMKYLLDVATKNHLSVSEGSEYHGEKKKQFVLGRSGCPKGAEAVIERFINSVEREDV